MTAPQAAGVIHGDFERGFIRAETFSYADLVRLGASIPLYGSMNGHRLKWEAKRLQKRSG
jgi:ribosome-binding ATPase YchF (GTP1/OBG family)